MALRYKTRKRLALLILIVGVPLYIVMAVTLADWLRGVTGRQSILIELLIFVGLGVVWIVPLKPIFKGIGQADPDAGPSPER